MDELNEMTLAEERERTYRFLSGLCLNPPTEEIINAIKDRSILSLIEDSGESTAWEEMAMFVSYSSQMDNLSEELTAERTSLFALPSAFIPHEAAYLDKDKRLGGKFTIAVRQFYEKAGADILNNCIEMPDHLGMELEFMAFLCKREKELRESCDFTGVANCIHLQKEFLDGHLLKWVFECCEKIIEKASYGFYKSIAHLIIEFMESEREYIAELYEGSDTYCVMHGAGI